MCGSFAQLVGLFDEVDDDHDGHLHYTEFLAATLETDGKKVADERLAEAFDQLDMDDSGHISRDNLMEFLGRDSKVGRKIKAHTGLFVCIELLDRVAVLPLLLLLLRTSPACTGMLLVVLPLLLLRRPRRIYC